MKNRFHIAFACSFALPFLMLTSAAQGQGYLRDDASSTHPSGITLNEVCANPQNKGSGFDYNANGSIDDNDEFIEIVNSSMSGIDIGGWILGNKSSNVTFPAGTVVPAGKAVVVFAGGIANFDPGAGNQAFVSGFALHNTNDAVGLRNENNLYIAAYWGSGTLNATITTGATLVGTDVDLIGFGSVGQSRTRTPDYTGSFSGHTTLSGTFNWSYNTPTRTLTNPKSSPGRFEANGDLLPVELVSFSAMADGHTVQLFWQTASETNNAGFEIHSKFGLPNLENGKDGWDVRGWVGGRGTTETPQQYRYRVENVAPGHHVFRLKQIDYDGTFEYSPEVEVRVELPGAYQFSAPHPNPFNRQTQFSLSVARRQRVEVAVYDVRGRRVGLLYAGTLEAGATRPLVFDAAGLPGGLYLIRAVGEHFVATRAVSRIE